MNMDDDINYYKPERRAVLRKEMVLSLISISSEEYDTAVRECGRAVVQTTGVLRAITNQELCTDAYIHGYLAGLNRGKLK